MLLLDHWPPTEETHKPYDFLLCHFQEIVYENIYHIIFIFYLSSKIDRYNNFSLNIEILEKKQIAEFKILCYRRI